MFQNNNNFNAYLSLVITQAVFAMVIFHQRTKIYINENQFPLQTNDSKMKLRESIQRIKDNFNEATPKSVFFQIQQLFWFFYALHPTSPWLPLVSSNLQFPGKYFPGFCCLQTMYIFTRSLRSLRTLTFLLKNKFNSKSMVRTQYESLNF